MSIECVKRAVVKLGTGVLTSGVGQLDMHKMKSICEQIALAKSRGIEVILVSSGAVGLGMGKLGLKSRPKQISTLQECAAVGQGILIQTWASLFAPFDITVAQILLTRDDVDILPRYKAMRNLLDRLLADNIVPIINENDCISAAELNIKFGDNDVLSALVASLSKADNLMILSTAPGLIDMQGTKEVVPVVEEITPAITAMACGTTSATAVGGMITKIKAAQIATKSACDVYIADGSAENIITKILDKQQIGTRFCACDKSTTSKKRWLEHFGKVLGKIFVDAGACEAIVTNGSSLLSAGIKKIDGNFKKGDMVEIMDVDNNYVIARGIAENDSISISNILQNKLDNHDVVVHRDNLALV